MLFIIFINKEGGEGVGVLDVTHHGRERTLELTLCLDCQIAAVSLNTAATEEKGSELQIAMSVAFPIIRCRGLYS